MLRRLFRNAIILNWSALILLESLAIGTIIFVRAKQHTIALLLHAKGLSPPRAVWVSRKILVLSILLPWVLLLVWMRIGLAILRRLRWKLDHCLHCNYDLTGNTTGTCPECGTPVDPNLWPRPPQSDSDPS